MLNKEIVKNLLKMQSHVYFQGGSITYFLIFY